MIKKALLLMVVLIALTACGGAADEVETPVTDNVALLTVTGGEMDVVYSLETLKSLPMQEALFSTEYTDDASYKGVGLTVLLEDAGFDLDTIQVVKAVAADGYTKNYDASFFTLPEATIAYERIDGPMDEDDGAFRLVFPGQAGEFSVRMLVEIQVIQ